MNEFTPISLKLPTPMVEALRKQAADELRSLTGQIRFILGRHLQLTEAESAADDSDEAEQSAKLKTDEP